MEQSSKIIQDIVDILNKNGIETNIEDVNTSITMPEIVYQDKDEVIFERKLIVEFKQYSVKKRRFEDGWEELV